MAFREATVHRGLRMVWATSHAFATRIPPSATLTKTSCPQVMGVRIAKQKTVDSGPSQWFESNDVKDSASLIENSFGARKLA